MNAYTPRTDEMHFVLSQVLGAPAQLQALPAFGEVDPDLMQQVLDEAGKFVGEVDLPEEEEPLLVETSRRFVLFPIRFHEVCFYFLACIRPRQ